MATAYKLGVGGPTGLNKTVLRMYFSKYLVSNFQPGSDSHDDMQVSACSLTIIEKNIDLFAEIQ